MEDFEKKAALQVTEKLGNGIELNFFDQSRLVAGDRWQIELLCEARIPVSEGMWERFKSEDTATLAGIRDNLGESLTFPLIKTRNFVDEKDKRKTFDELVLQVKENMLVYLAAADFPQRLFEQHYKAAREECRLKGQARPEQMQAGTDDEPADFSACFR